MNKTGCHKTLECFEVKRQMLETHYFALKSWHESPTNEMK